MFRFPFQWMLRRHIWAAVLVLRVYLERRADQLNQSKSQEHLCPCTAHFSWHLVALSQNFTVKLVIMFTQGKITWKSICRQTSKQLRIRRQLNVSKFGEHLCPVPPTPAGIWQHCLVAGFETDAENLRCSQLRNATLFACLVNQPLALTLKSFGSLDVAKILAEGDNTLLAPCLQPIQNWGLFWRHGQLNARQSKRKSWKQHCLLFHSFQQLRPTTVSNRWLCQILIPPTSLPFRHS